MDASQETPFDGGHLSTFVVRVGDTVRRPVGDWTPAVHTLLSHLEQVGFEGAPRVRGLDDKGREILTYLPGEAASGAPPQYVWSDSNLANVANLLRRYHDAVSTFVPPSNARWQVTDVDHGEPELICHHDIAPWNTVFTNGKPVAFIDWDLAGPGSRVAEISYALWHFVPIYEERKCMELGCNADLDHRAQRIRQFLDAYGMTPPHQFAETIMRVQWRTCDRIRRLATQANEPYAKLWEAGAGEGIQRELAFVEANARALIRYL